MRGQQGITLLEAIIVVAILGILITLALPLYRSLTSDRRVDRVAQGIAGLIRSAQQSAVGDSVDGCYRVQVGAASATVERVARDLATRACGWTSPSVVRATDPFPIGVIVATATVEFTSGGDVAGGSSFSISISSGGQTRSVDVHGQTGRVLIGP